MKMNLAITNKQHIEHEVLRRTPVRKSRNLELLVSHGSIINQAMNTEEQATGKQTLYDHS